MSCSVQLWEAFQIFTELPTKLIELAIVPSSRTSSSLTLDKFHPKPKAISVYKGVCVSSNFKDADVLWVFGSKPTWIHS